MTLLGKNKTLWLLSAAIVALAFVLSIALYDRLPDPLPTHWGLSGEPDGFTAKPWGAFVLPVLLAALAVFFALLPVLSPEGYRLDVTSTGYRWTVATTLLLLL